MCHRVKRGIAWNDPDLEIDWRIPVDQVVLGEKDKLHSGLRDLFQL